MTRPNIAQHHLDRLAALSIKERILLHEWCRGICDNSLKFKNQPRCVDAVENLTDELFSDIAGMMMDKIIESLLDEVPADRQEADELALILIPYHIENESLSRSGQELARLLYLTSGPMAKAA